MTASHPFGLDLPDFMAVDFSMTKFFSSRHWSFSQSVAWVMYRRRDLVEHVGGGGSVGQIALYPNLFSPKPERHAAPKELVSTLKNGQLVAEGIRVGGAGARETIPASEWSSVQISGDHLTWVSGGNTVPTRWTDILLDRAAVLRRWRAPNEVDARTKFDWPVLREMHDEMRARHAEFSQNELITELQGAYRDRFNKEPPSRSTLQRQIRQWS